MKFVFGVIITILVLIFVAQNPQVVDITYLKWTFSVSRSIMYLIIFIFGIITGGLIVGLKKRKN